MTRSPTYPNMPHQRRLCAIESIWVKSCLHLPSLFTVYSPDLRVEVKGSGSTVGERITLITITSREPNTPDLYKGCLSSKALLSQDLSVEVLFVKCLTEGMLGSGFLWFEDFPNTAEDLSQDLKPSILTLHQTSMS